MLLADHLTEIFVADKYVWRLGKYYVSECKYLLEFLNTEKILGEHGKFGGESHC